MSNIGTPVRKVTIIPIRLPVPPTKEPAEKALPEKAPEKVPA